MGLDQYAHMFRATGPVPAVDGQLPDQADDLYYWRKHPNLQGWMEQLYRRKGGTAPDFNCVCVQLLAPDLDELEHAVRTATLPHTEGFFFGISQLSDYDRDLEFIAKARAALADGMVVMYSSWW